MKKLTVFIPLLLLLTSCGQKTIPTIDTVPPVAPKINVNARLSEPDVPTVELYTTEEPEVVEDVPEWKSLGTFSMTAYCACMQCCGKTDGITATGTIATQGRTIAVDPTIIAYGTQVKIGDTVYVAEDCGGGIKNNHIDVFFNDHDEALQFGVQTSEVFILEGE